MIDDIYSSNFFLEVQDAIRVAGYKMNPVKFNLFLAQFVLNGVTLVF